MKKIYRGRRKQIQVKRYFINEQIRVPSLRVLDEEGKMLGIFDTKAALEMAMEKGQDLVEISPNAKPPVAKIIDYGKFQYQQEKFQKKQKSQIKKIDIKGIRLSPRISSHDLGIRVDQAKKFLEKGQKVRIEIVLRGREHQFAESVKKLIKEFVDKLETPVTIEQQLLKQGNRFSMQVAPKK